MPPRGRLSAGKIYWGTIVFLLGFVVLLVIVSNYYLLPAFEAAQDADRQGKLQLVAWSRLLFVIVITTLIGGLMLSFRFGRFFLPRANRSSYSHTEYPDAWSESAKRMPIPTEDDSENPQDH